MLASLVLSDAESRFAYVLILLLAGPGAKILLNNATLHLKRGKRYGLCGPNGVGKSTLMRSIANGQLDGFPPKEVRHCARSVFYPYPNKVACLRSTAKPTSRWTACVAVLRCH